MTGPAMRPLVTYDTKHPIDDQWPVPINPDGRITMRNVPYPDGIVEEDIWCGTCTHAGRCHW